MSTIKIELELVNQGIQFLNAANRDWTARVFQGKNTDPVPSYKAAIDSFEKSLSLNPNQPNAWHLLGQANFSLGAETKDAAKFQRTVECCGKALQSASYDKSLQTECESLTRQARQLLDSLAGSAGKATTPAESKPVSEIYFIDESCIQCGACEAECPFSAISEQAGGYRIDEELCISGSCAACMDVCPVNAIQAISSESGPRRGQESL